MSFSIKGGFPHSQARFGHPWSRFFRYPYRQIFLGYLENLAWERQNRSFFENNTLAQLVSHYWEGFPRPESQFLGVRGSRNAPNQLKWRFRVPQLALAPPIGGLSCSGRENRTVLIKRCHFQAASGKVAISPTFLKLAIKSTFPIGLGLVLPAGCYMDGLNWEYSMLYPKSKRIKAILSPKLDNATPEAILFPPNE